VDESRRSYGKGPYARRSGCDHAIVDRKKHGGRMYMLAAFDAFKNL
jgi:hypothetical protein